MEWLGEIPEGWKSKRVKYLFDNLDYRRIPLSSEERSELDQIYPYYGASGVIDAVDRFIFDEDLVLVGEDGANLILRNSPLAFIATGKYWVNNHAHILRPKGGSIGFWAQALESFDFTLLVTGAAQPKLTAENLASVALPTPTDSEQSTIAAFLTRETTKIDTLVRETQDAIELLMEHRSALITATVTGKINVEGHAPEASA